MRKGRFMHSQIGKFLFLKRYSYYYVIYIIMLLEKAYTYPIDIFKITNIFYFLT